MSDDTTTFLAKRQLIGCLSALIVSPVKDVNFFCIDFLIPHLRLCLTYPLALITPALILPSCLGSDSTAGTEQEQTDFCKPAAAEVDSCEHLRKDWNV